MVIELKPGWRGIQVKSPKIMNKLLRGVMFDPYFELEETKNCYLSLTNELFKVKAVFSYYKDINIEFQDNNIETGEIEKEPDFYLDIGNLTIRKTNK